MGANYTDKPCESCGEMMFRVGHRKRWCSTCNDGQMASQVLHLYGLHPSEHRDMLERQGGTCAICDRECATRGRLSVDHDHKTGKVRGLLCNDCNTSLGKMGDDPERLRRAADYIEANMGGDLARDSRCGLSQIDLL